MGKSSPPPAPDPKETAAASTGTNVGTAIANSMLSGVNQVGPDGTKTREQTGSYQYTDPYTGQSYTIPTFTETTTLSSGQQKLYDLNNATQQQLGQIGLDQSQKIGGLLGTNVDLSNDAVEGRLFDLGSARLNPLFDRQQEALRTRLLNSGIREGSDAWNNAMTGQTQRENDAYNQLLLTGRGQAVQEALTERNQPINEITALLSGSQVSQPQFGNVNMPTIPTTDTAGLINQNYAQQVAAYNSKNAAMGGLFSGLGSFAGSLIGLSDDDAKKDKKRLADVDGEMGLWEFRYKGEPKKQPKHIGLMASEVEKVRPDAVHRGRDGLRRVDYGKALGLMDAA